MGSLASVNVSYLGIVMKMKLPCPIYLIGFQSLLHSHYLQLTSLDFSDPKFSFF